VVGGSGRRQRAALSIDTCARGQRGAALIDVVVACGVLLVVGGIAVPELNKLHGHAKIVAATRFISARLHAARFEAIRRNVVIAVRIADPADGYAFTLIADGNGNGVLQRDIDLGIDAPLGPADRLDHHFPDVTFRVRDEVPDIDGSGVVVADSDPVRFGRSDLISFNPIGGCTSGTLYIAGDTGPQAAVRLLGSTSRMRAMWFDSHTGQWRAD
jgi:hypothetical protein